MAIHKVSTVQRRRGGMRQASPRECMEHDAAGRIPVFHGVRVVAYVDSPEDMPEALFENRYGKTVGRVFAWDHDAA